MEDVPQGNPIPHQDLDTFLIVHISAGPKQLPHNEPECVCVPSVILAGSERLLARNRAQDDCERVWPGYESESSSEHFEGALAKLSERCWRQGDRRLLLTLTHSSFPSRIGLATLATLTIPSRTSPTSGAISF